MPINQIDKKEIKKLLEIPGKVRGVVFRTDIDYIKEKKGKEGVKLFEEKIKELELPIDYKNIKITDWYPVGLRAVSLLVIKGLFGWGDKEIEELGNCAPKYSFVVGILMKQFLSLQKTFKESPKYWEGHYNIGRLEPAEINEKDKRLVLRLRDFKVHPVLCVLFKGYFLRIAQLTIKSKKISIKETKCMFLGDPYHEYIIKWE